MFALFIFVFVYLYLCMCICVFVFVYLYLCICIFCLCSHMTIINQDRTFCLPEIFWPFSPCFFLWSVGGGQQAPVLYRISSLSANAVLTAYRQVFPCVTNDNCTHFSINTFRNCQIFGPALTIVGFFIFAKPRIIKVLTPRVT